jgi:hypothetical protein
LVYAISLLRGLTAGYLPVPPAVRNELGKIGPVMGISLTRLARFPRPPNLPFGACATKHPAKDRTATPGKYIVQESINLFTMKFVNCGATLVYNLL